MIFGLPPISFKSLRNWRPWFYPIAHDWPSPSTHQLQLLHHSARRMWFGSTPQPATVTTSIITFLVGNPNLNLHLPLESCGEAISGSSSFLFCSRGSRSWCYKKTTLDSLHRGRGKIPWHLAITCWEDTTSDHEPQKVWRYDGGNNEFDSTDPVFSGYILVPEIYKSSRKASPKFINNLRHTPPHRKKVNSSHSENSWWHDNCWLRIEHAWCSTIYNKSSKTHSFC